MMNCSRLLDQSADVSARQFGVFRIALGAFLLVHFAHLLPYAAELFGSAGILADPTLNLIPQILPNPLWMDAAPDWLPFCVVVAGMLAALGILIGYGRRVCCVIAWLVWAWLFARNNLISNPGLPYVGMLLLLSAAIPTGERFSIRSAKAHAASWQFPTLAIRTVWFLLAAGYTFSGVMKLGSPSWLDGSALRDVMLNPLARPGFFRDVFLHLPDLLTNLATWATLALEIAFLPLAFSRRVRPWIWMAMVLMHLGIMLLVDFADLSLGMLLAHLFVFDSAWVPVAWRSKCRIVFQNAARTWSA